MVFAMLPFSTTFIAWQMVIKLKTHGEYIGSSEIKLVSS